MKNLAGKIPVFYYFQLDSNKDYNVLTLPTGPQPPTIKDVLAALPIDLSHGLYHFRFKSQLPDGQDKIIAWIDINNLGAKVPQLNGCIYMKILSLKDPSHNKLFHIDKLKKAQIVRIPSHSHSLQPPHVNSHPRPTAVSPNPQATRVQPTPSAPNSVKNPPPTQASRSPPGSSKIPQASVPQQKPKTVPPAPPKPKSPSLAKPGLSKDSNFINFEQHPQMSQQTRIKLQVFKNQINQEENNRQNQKIAQEELEDIIRKWGYTDGKKINNTPTLLATLHQIWPEWEPVSLTDMLKPQQVAILFKKAAIKLHPDKNRHRHFKEKYLSKRVFELLNESRKQ